MSGQEYVECIICGDKRLVKRLKSFGGALVKCIECGMVFRNPSPSSEKIREYYKNTYANIFTEEKTKGYRRTIFDYFLRRLSKESNGGRLLDIGCGYGEFLKMAKAEGWNAYGVELSISACQYVQNTLGLNLFCGELKEASFPKDYFDVITLWNVLDHTDNPLVQLQEIKRILKPQGLLFIRVPNFSFQQKVFFFCAMADKLLLNRTNLSRKTTISHLYCFTSSSIRKLIEVTGFPFSRIRNARLSKGDPYHAFPWLGDRIITFVKNSFFIICEALYYLSLRKILLGPSIEVFVYKSY